MEQPPRTDSDPGLWNSGCEWNFGTFGIFFLGLLGFFFLGRELIKKKKKEIKAKKSEKKGIENSFQALLLRDPGTAGIAAG